MAIIVRDVWQQSEAEKAQLNYVQLESQASFKWVRPVQMCALMHEWIREVVCLRIQLLRHIVAQSSSESSQKDFHHISSITTFRSERAALSYT